MGCFPFTDRSPPPVWKMRAPSATAGALERPPPKAVECVFTLYWIT